MGHAAAKFNVYAHVTQTILAELEKGTVPWQRGWTGSSNDLGLPLRVTGEPYRGINVLMLWLESHLKGYVSPTWMTYRQAQELGGQVRKGETSTTVVKYGTFEAETSDVASGDKQAEQRGYARAYRVFNVSQIEGLPAQFYAQTPPARDLGTKIDPMIAQWFISLGIAIDTSDEPAAYYRPSTDRIHMPPMKTFKSAAAYIGTLAHEAAHATKAEHRLNRSHKGTSQERYAQEEVVAELAAAMVSTRLGIVTEYTQNAAYLGHWIEVMRADNRAIMRAASMAQAAADWMFETADTAALQIAA